MGQMEEPAEFQSLVEELESSIWSMSAQTPPVRWAKDRVRYHTGRRVSSPKIIEKVIIFQYELYQVFHDISIHIAEIDYVPSGLGEGTPERETKELRFGACRSLLNLVEPFVNTERKSNVHPRQHGGITFHLTLHDKAGEASWPTTCEKYFEASNIQRKP